LAELRAERQTISTMADWKKQLDDFLTLYEYDKYNDTSAISAEQAKEKAYAEYDKFRLIQDKEYLSDFDKEIKRWKEKGLFGKRKLSEMSSSQLVDFPKSRHLPNVEKSFPIFKS
jgi:hypothetical protein